MSFFTRWTYLIPFHLIAKLSLIQNIYFEFHLIEFYTLTTPNASALSRLTSMEIKDIPSEFLSQETVEFLMQFSNLESVWFEAFVNPLELLAWIASLPSLKNSTGPECDKKK